MPVSDPLDPLDAAHGFIKPPVSEKNQKFAFTLLGLYLGLAAALFLACCEHSRFGKRPYVTMFKFLIWTQFICSFIMELLQFFKIINVIEPSFGYYFGEVHCLVQIQCNRVGILMVNPTRRRQIKLGVFAYMIVVCAFSGSSWVPSSLQVDDPNFMIILRPFSLVVSCMIMFIDIVLNVWFVMTVKQRLVSLGLYKYNHLVFLNTLTLIGAVSLDALIIGLMYYEEPQIYVMIYPLCYNVKLAVELALSTLIIRIANEKSVHRLPTSGKESGVHEASIFVKTENDVQLVKSEIELPPQSFGQLIKRPENWQDTFIAEVDEQSEKTNLSYELGELKNNDHGEAV